MLLAIYREFVIKLKNMKERQLHKIVPFYYQRESEGSIAAPSNSLLPQTQFLGYAGVGTILASPEQESDSC